MHGCEWRRRRDAWSIGYLARHKDLRISIDTHRKRAWTALTNSGTPGRTQVFDIERLVSGAL